MGRWVERRRLIHIVDSAPSRTGNRYIKWPIAFVYQQDAPFPIVRCESEGIDKSIAGRWTEFGFNRLVPGAKIIVQEFQSPEPRVWLASVPIDHGNAGK